MKAARVARRLAAGATYEAMTVVGRYPGPTLAAARRLGHGVPVEAATDILVEGYPRSGNSLAVAALSISQPGPLAIAHHVHAPGHVLAAVRLGIPALVVIRPAEESVIAFVEGKPSIGVGAALRGYVRFYRPLLSVRDRLVVATFREVTEEFGSVIERLNARFGLALAPFRNTLAERRASQEAIERYFGERAGPGLPLVGRSAEAMGGAGADLLARFRAPGLARLRGRAQSLFRRLASR